MEDARDREGHAAPAEPSLEGGVDQTDEEHDGEEDEERVDELQEPAAHGESPPDRAGPEEKSDKDEGGWKAEPL